MTTSETITIVTGPNGESWLEAKLRESAEKFKLMGRYKLIGHIMEAQPKLWELECKLGTHFDSRFRLKKGWTSSSLDELAKLAATIKHTQNIREIELEGIENGRAKKERIAEKKRKAESEIRAQHELEMKRISDERNARRDARKAELNGIVSGYTELVTKLLAHPVFQRASFKLPKLGIDLHTELMLGSLGEEGYQLLLTKARTEIANTKRKLREPLRRAHESAKARNLTKLDFESYLEQEGFSQLFVK